VPLAIVPLALASLARVQVALAFTPLPCRIANPKLTASMTASVVSRHQEAFE